MYQFPECDSDEDEEFKQLDKELKVSRFPDYLLIHFKLMATDRQSEAIKQGQQIT